LVIIVSGSWSRKPLQLLNDKSPAAITENKYFFFIL
jgi:hypothetical protein